MDRRRLVTFRRHDQVGPARWFQWAGLASALIGVLALAIKAACDTSVAEENRGYVNAVTCSQPVPVRDLATCQTIDVDGTTYRFAVVTDTDPEIARLVIVDPGGPGASALVTAHFHQIVDERRRATVAPGTAYLIVEEPWVTRNTPDTICSRAGAEFLLAAGAGPVPEAIGQSLRTSCSSHDYGWSADRYRRVVRSISEKLNAPVSGFLGLSFAAHRLTWLVTDGHFPIAAAILVNPLLPGLQAAEVLHHQASAIDRIAENSSISADTANGRLLAAIGSQLPVSLVTAPADMDGHEATEIERLAATYLGEYGEGQLALGRLAYFQELCSAGFSPTPDGAFADRSPVYTYLASLHAGCPDTPPTKPFSLVSRKIEMCVVVSTQDAVIPYRPTTALLAGHDYRVSALPHADLRGLDLCADFTI